MTTTEVVNKMRELGFKWDTKTIGIKFERGRWNVNAMLINEDGSKKPAYGFLGFETVDEAVEAQIAMQAAE